MSAKGPSLAMVMAAGLGTRMRPLTNSRPKPLIEVAGRPLIDHILDRLAAVGVETAIVNVHAFADQMEAHLSNRRRPRVLISDERAELLETGGGLKHARHLTGEDAIWIANADYVWLEEGRPALQAVIDAWDPERMDACLLVLPQAQTSGWPERGDFFLEGDGRLRHRGDAASAPLNYVGFQIMRPGLVDEIDQTKFSLFEVWTRAIARGRLYGVTADAFWMQIGDPQALAAAEARLR